MNILGLSGSLRKNSSHSKILETLAKLAPKNVTFKISIHIDQLPHYNKDLDKEELLPSNVKLWRRELQQADGFYISCPEYSHKVPEIFKNALDWIMTSKEFANKPIAFINSSPLVQNTLSQICQSMSARIIEVASIDTQFINKTETQRDFGDEEEIKHALESSLQIMIREIQEK